MRGSGVTPKAVESPTAGNGGAPKPQAEPQYLAVPFEIARTLPERLRLLLGYFVHEPNLGSLEGQDPIRLLTGELTINGHFQEFVPPIPGWGRNGISRPRLFAVLEPVTLAVHLSRLIFFSHPANPLHF
jgi:hypothetical protein